VLVAGPTARGEPRRPREQVRGGMHAPASAAFPPWRSQGWKSVWSPRARGSA